MNAERFGARADDRGERLRRETWRDATTNRLDLGMWSGKVLACRFAAFVLLMATFMTGVALRYRADMLQERSATVDRDGGFAPPGAATHEGSRAPTSASAGDAPHATGQRP